MTEQVPAEMAEVGDPPFTVRAVWGEPDLKVRADAVALWAELGILPAQVDPESRADELCTVAYVGERLVGVCTVTFQRLESLRRRFGFFRVLVHPDFRRLGINGELNHAAHDAIEAWSRAHPDEKVMGMAAIIQNRGLLASRQPAFYPGRGLTLVGYTAGGERIRVAWFAHARLGEAGSEPPHETADDASIDALTFTAVWPAADAQTRAAVMAFWRDRDALPPGADPEARADDLCVVARRGDAIAAVCSVTIAPFAQVRQNIAWLRMLAPPEAGGRSLRLALADRAVAALDSWSAANPAAGALGVGLVGGGADVEGRRDVAGAATAFVLAGYAPSGEAIRIAWFSHAQI